MGERETRMSKSPVCVGESQEAEGKLALAQAVGGGGEARRARVWSNCGPPAVKRDTGVKSRTGVEVVVKR